MKITGGCLCGAVRYQADGTPVYAVHCYCRDCQRVSGTGHVPVLGMPKASFKVEGQTRSYAARGTSGLPSPRHFCPICGSLLFGTPESAPEAVSIYVGTLDQPSLFQPDTILFKRNRHAWDELVGSLTAYDGLPPG